MSNGGQPSTLCRSEAADPLVSVDALQALAVWAARAHTLAVSALLAAAIDAGVLLAYLFLSQRTVTRQNVIQEESQRYTVTEPILQPLAPETVAIAAVALSRFVFLVLAGAVATTFPRGVRSGSTMALLRSAERTHWYAFGLLVTGLLCLVLVLFSIVIAERNFLLFNTFM